MKKNIKFTFICLIMCFVSVFSFLSFKVNAESIPSERQLERVVDNAELLNESDEAELLSKLNEISERQKCDVVIVTVPSLEGKTPTEYADDFFDYNGYGMGSGKDGILFLISMDERKWAISTHGAGIQDFTDAGQAYIMDNVKPSLSDGDYNAAFIEFADNCDNFLTQAATGKPYDVNNLPKKDYTWVVIGGSVLGGIIISLIIMLVWKKSTLTSVQMESAANVYVVPGSLNLRNREDRFLYKNVSRSLKPKDDGGSSTHISSSGESHGGSSGSF